MLHDALRCSCTCRMHQHLIPILAKLLIRLRGGPRLPACKGLLQACGQLADKEELRDVIDS